MAATQGPLDLELRQRPIRELRAALVRLGRPIAGCVERGDFISCLLGATEAELLTALGAQATKGPTEHAALVRQLLDGVTKPKLDDLSSSDASERLASGSVVRLFNLQSAPALNMQRAVVTRYDATTDRYEVRLDWDGSVKKVRYDNLQVEENSTPPPASTPSCQPPAASVPEHGSPLPAASAGNAAVSSSVGPASTASSTAVVAAPEPGLQAAPASPERSRTHAIGASPAESIADSLVEALAAECGLDALETPVKSPAHEVEDPEDSPCAADEAIALPMPCSSAGEPIALGMPPSSSNSQGKPIVLAMPPSTTNSGEGPIALGMPTSFGSSAGLPIILPIPTVDDAAESRADDASMGISEPVALCQDGAEPRPEVADSSATTSHILPMDIAKSMDINVQDQSETPKGSKRPADEIAHCPKDLPTPTSPAAAVTLPTASKLLGKEAPVSATSFASGPPKKAVKLRVGYDVGRHPSEERGLMAESLRQLWRAGEMCDLTLGCRESTFLVHRLVLASQSTELREYISTHAVVQVHHVAYPESLQILIESVYEAEGEKGYAPSCYDVNMEVLELAHRFQLLGLKRRAASFMAQNLTSHNVLRCLGDCETFALQDLKEKIISHLAVNKKVLADITDGPDISKHPELLRQILVRVSAPKDNTASSKRVRVSHSQ